jgi:hypothetical protein
VDAVCAVGAKAAELRSKILRGVSLPQYHETVQHSHAQAAQMWSAASGDSSGGGSGGSSREGARDTDAAAAAAVGGAQQPPPPQALRAVGCTREQLYRHGADSHSIERAYRAIYSYSVGLPLAVKELTEGCCLAGEGGAEEMAQKLLGLCVTVQHEAIKCVHGDGVAAQVQDVVPPPRHQCTLVSWSEALGWLRFTYVSRCRHGC